MGTISHTHWGKVVGCGLLIDLFCFYVLGSGWLRFSLAGNIATGALTALQLCFSEAVASVSSGTTIGR